MVERRERLRAEAVAGRGRDGAGGGAFRRRRARHATLIATATATATATALALAGTGTGTGTSTGTGASIPAPTATCHARLTLVARGQGSPDDLAWDGRRLLVGDINRGKVGVLARDRVRTLVAGLREPEGLLAGPHRSLIVVQQATNSVVEITRRTGKRTTLVKLALPHGKTGLDGINAEGAGRILIPDSARGRLYVLGLRRRKLTLLAAGMNRPVAAIRWRGTIVVADEYANVVWRLGRTRTPLAPIPLPDDLAIVSGHLIATSLTGQVWEIAPHRRLLSSAFGPTTSDPQGLVAERRDAVIVADEARNGIYPLSQRKACL